MTSDARPLQEPTFLVLCALLERPRHGYALIGEIEHLSGGRVTLRVGTLYAALERLTGEGLVEVDSEEIVSGRPRRTYRITGSGARVLATEAERMASLAAQARTRLSAFGLPGVAR